MDNVSDEIKHLKERVSSDRIKAESQAKIAQLTKERDFYRDESMKLSKQLRDAEDKISVLEIKLHNQSQIAASVKHAGDTTKSPSRASGRASDMQFS